MGDSKGLPDRMYLAIAIVFNMTPYFSVASHNVTEPLLAYTIFATGFLMNLNPLSLSPVTNCCKT